MKSKTKKRLLIAFGIIYLVWQLVNSYFRISEANETKQDMPWVFILLDLGFGIGMLIAMISLAKNLDKSDG